MAARPQRSCRLGGRPRGVQRDDLDPQVVERATGEPARPQVWGPNWYRTADDTILHNDRRASALTGRRQPHCRTDRHLRRRPAYRRWLSPATGVPGSRVLRRWVARLSSELTADACTSSPTTVDCPALVRSCLPSLTRTGPSPVVWKRLWVGSGVTFSRLASYVPRPSEPGGRISFGHLNDKHGTELTKPIEVRHRAAERQPNCSHAGFSFACRSRSRRDLIAEDDAPKAL